MSDIQESAALCGKYGEHPATTHHAYDEGVSLRLGHFCEVCARHEPPGWFGTFRRSTSGRLDR